MVEVAPVFDDEEAEHSIAQDAVERAIGQGLSPEFAEQLYGYRGLEKAYDPNQLRHPKGSREGGRWAKQPNVYDRPTVVDGGQEGAEGLKKYIDMVAPMSPAYKWYQEHGRPYTIDEDTFIGGKPKMCYMNTFQATWDRDLTYVEGYMSVHGVPIHHAWAVTKDGKVRDYTIKESDREIVKGYFGVPMKRDFVEKIAMKTRVYGITAGHENWEEILKTDPSEIVEK